MHFMTELTSDRRMSRTEHTCRIRGEQRMDLQAMIVRLESMRDSHVITDAR